MVSIFCSKEPRSLLFCPRVYSLVFWPAWFISNPELEILLPSDPESQGRSCLAKDYTHFKTFLRPFPSSPDQFIEELPTMESARTQRLNGALPSSSRLGRLAPPRQAGKSSQDPRDMTTKEPQYEYAPGAYPPGRNPARHTNRTAPGAYSYWGSFVVMSRGS
jgi:hypothetical protein